MRVTDEFVKDLKVTANNIRKSIIEEVYSIYFERI